MERAASPLHKVAADPPPFLLAVGEHDFKHLFRQAESFEVRLRSMRGTVRWVVFPGADHFDASIQAGIRSGPWIRRADSFMADCLSNRSKDENSSGVRP